MTDSHREDPETKTQDGGVVKQDVSEAPVVCEKDHTEPNLESEETTDKNSKQMMESEEGEIHEGKESVPLSEETPKRDEGPPNEGEEFEEGYAVKTIDAQEEDDYKWEVSCCGVDIPMAK